MLAKSMPQRLRHKLGALDDFAAAFRRRGAARRMCRWPRPCAATCASNSTSTCPLDAFRPDSAPPHLHMNFRVLGDDGRQLEMDRNLGRAEAQAGQENRGDPAGGSAGRRRRALYRLDHGRSARADGDRARRPHAGRLSGAGRRRRGGHAAGVRFAGEGARDASRRACCGCSAIAFRDRIRDLERSLAKDIVLGPLKERRDRGGAGERTFLAGFGCR